MLTETVEHLMWCLEGRHREVLTLSLQGHPPAEISSRLRCTERTVYRVLERVKQYLEAMQSGQGEG
jgi:DNA-binding CsgD family transcriptional regulator